MLSTCDECGARLIWIDPRTGTMMCERLYALLEERLAKGDRRPASHADLQVTKSKERS